jgi:hypothetical protein
MVIKDKHEKLEQTKDELIKLRDKVRSNEYQSMTYNRISETDIVKRLDNILNLLFDNDLYTPTK